MKKSSLKQAVKTHWEDETCGVRYGTSSDRASWFAEIEQARYKLEPHILAFADFPSAKGKKVLEIGVGAGSDFSQWVQNGAEATGIDLTEAAIQLTKEHLQFRNLPLATGTLQVADAEHLSFPNNSFDIVYSWGVLHHTPETAQALRECFRVLAPGGMLKIMMYHLPSWTGWMLWTDSLFRKKKLYRSPREAMFENLESPGTKAYTISEARVLLDGIGFQNIHLETRLSAGDLLEIQPSKKYQSRLARLLWKFYPRWLVRAFGDRFGLELLITAKK
jgi:ubiquinone/menaquinone biosynthesis C-methylase UbiE